MTALRWEYRLLEAGYEEGSFSRRDPITEEDLDTLGGQGWEAVSVRFFNDFGIAAVLLKRPRNLTNALARPEST